MLGWKSQTEYKIQSTKDLQMKHLMFDSHVLARNPVILYEI